MKLALAPLRGVTHLTFRRCLQDHFGGFDYAVSPFLTTVAGTKIKATHLADILPEANRSLPLVPQIIGKNPAEFRTLLTAIRDLGYDRCDLNAGCPWPMIIKKGRGAGLLRDADSLRRMLDAGCEVMGGGLSVKVRLGIDSPGLLLERLDVLNQYPLAELTIHARTARQRYEGQVDLEAFAGALASSKAPVVYNGDIRSVEDIAVLRGRFPSVRAWMIGRGAAVDPGLAARIRGEATDGYAGRLRSFFADYDTRTRDELFGPASFLGRMKEFWSYFHAAFAQGEALWRELRMTRSYAEYDGVVARFWDSSPGIAPPVSSLPVD